MGWTADGEMRMLQGRMVRMRMGRKVEALVGMPMHMRRKVRRLLLLLLLGLQMGQQR